MATRQQKFYDEVYAGARQAGLSDSRARLAAAQASLETGYGKSMPGGNMFGIKAGKSWKGPTQKVNTWEDVGGRVNVVDKFRSYANPFESLSDWVGMTDRRFPEASAATSFTDAVSGLRAGQPGGYATDRKYSSKLKSIDQKFGAAAQQNYGTMGRDLPVPSAAPRGVMDALGSTPKEVAAFTDRGLRSASFPATPSPVQRGGNLAAPGFDVERFGPAPSTMNFDAGRFGPTTPNQSYASLVASAKPASTFDTGRFGPAAPAPQAQGVEGLRAGLLAAAPPAQKVASFQGPVMPGMEPAMANANLALDVAQQRAAMGLAPAVQPTAYVDPAVSVQGPAYSQPAQAAQAAPARASAAVAPQPTGGFGPSMTQAQADKMIKDLERRQMMGGVLGGITGGMLLGPLGALGAGYLGRQYAAKTYYPTAPAPAPNPDRKGYGKDSLSSYGEKVSRESKQFDKAVSSGRGGLW